ncbi:S1/P1 nuclease [Arenimonas alkanexedens]
MKRTLSTLFLLALAGQALAWSKQGHQLVGELAERQLSPAALAETRRLLADEPEPTLAGVSTWADQIRAESRGAGNPLGERSSRWHYVNFPSEGCGYVAARDCPDGNCVIGAINAQAAILADRGRSDEDRRNALKFVVHFVGDAHQPMHAGFAHDRGGNSFQVNYRGKGEPDGQGTNLHGVWDYWLLRSANLDNAAYVEQLSQSPLSADPAAAALNPALEWTLESCRLIASERLYPSSRSRNVGDAYLDKHRPTAEHRVRQAGDRLARLLNDALAPTP